MIFRHYIYMHTGYKIKKLHAILECKLQIKLIEADTFDS